MHLQKGIAENLEKSRRLFNRSKLFCIMKKYVVSFVVVLLLAVFATHATVQAGTCDGNCGGRNPELECVFYNGPGDHGKCIGWAEKPDIIP